MTNTTPDWIAQSKANREQLRDAYDVALETLNLKASAYTELCHQREAALRLLNRTEPPLRAPCEIELLALQSRVVVACQDWQRAFAIAEELRQAVMR
jgi:hypothetical protein